MKKVLVNFLIITAFAVSAACMSCNKDDSPPFKIKGLTLENFPVIDGSTSTDPLVKIIACKLLGYKYEWRRSYSTDGSWYISSDLPDEFVNAHLKASQTHNAFINLIDRNADMIFSARKMSDDEKAYATEAGVLLIETPVALDALIFIVNSMNQVKSLTHQQLLDIYYGTIKNWQVVGGENAPIMPFVRNKNSGSQELMETFLLHEPISDDFPNDDIISIISMLYLLTAIETSPYGLGYTVHYYKENIFKDVKNINTIAVNNIYPDKRTIANRTYPYTAEVYAIIHSDLDKSSMAYKIYELLQTEAGKRVISESGYVPN